MARAGDEAKVREGLRQLAMHYWRPLYLFLRKRGENHDDAADSVQGFFAFLCSSGFLDHVERDGGKFRSYLLASLERWRSRVRTRDRAQKRGGLADHVPLEDLEEMQDSAALADASISPELAFDRQWAAELIRSTMQSLREGFAKRNRLEWFEALSPSLPGGSGLPAYQVMAVRLNCSEGAIKKAVFDLRQAFATRLREEIRSTVRTNEDAEEELRHLVSMIGS